MLSSPRRTMVFWTLMIANFSMSMTIVSMSVMLPPIMAAFQIPTSLVQWLTSGASLVSGIMVPVAAYLIKRFPNKVYLVFSMALFSLGSFLGSVAGNFPILLTGRLIQAVGGGLTMPFTQIMLMSIYPREKQGTVMGYFTLGMLIAPVISPYIAGLVIDNLGWQFMFNILFYLSLAAMIMGLIFMKNISENYKLSISLVSIFLSSFGFFALLIGLGNISGSSLFSLETGGSILAGLISLGLFVSLQLRLENPLLDLKIFRYPMFRTALFIAVTMYMSFGGGIIILPIYGQSLRGFSATLYAIIVLPGSVLMALVTVLSGRLYDKHGPNLILVSGALLVFIGNIMGVLFNMNTSPIYMGIASFLPAAGVAVIMPLIVPMAIGHMDDKGRVDGSAVLSTIRLIVNAIAGTYSILLFTVFSSLYDNIMGIRASYLNAVVFSILLLAITVFFMKNNKAKI